MARKNTLLIALTSFVIVLLLIALVKYLFPRSVMGFTDMSCYGVACQEGEFCQSGSCKKIYPNPTNNYYNEGVEGFQDSCPPGTKKTENGDCQATEGFMDQGTITSLAIGIPVTVFLLGIIGLAYLMWSDYRSSFPTRASTTGYPRVNARTV